MRNMRKKCLISRSVRNPKAICRWVQMNWTRRVRVTERELGGEIQAC